MPPGGWSTPVPEAPATPEELFRGHPVGLEVCRAVAAAAQTLGEFEERVSRSQVAFRRRRGFAYVWRPGQYVTSDVPAVLSIPLGRRDGSGRWKEVAHPSRDVWMHHLEVADPREIDDEVRGWIREAWLAAE